MTHVVVADDSAVMRRIVVRALRQAGFDGLQVSEAADGEALVAVVGAEAPDLVLSDWNMPNLSGIEALRRLRATGSTVPFGFVTSEGSAGMRAEAEAAGADFLVTKPFSPEDLEAAVGGALRARR